MTIPPVDGAVSKITSCVRPDTTPDDGKDGEDDIPESLCCLEGCLTGTVVAVLFLLVIPSGVILSVYAASADSQGVLAVGVILIVSPVLAIPVIIAVVRSKRRLKKLRKNKVVHFADQTQERY